MFCPECGNPQTDTPRQQAPADLPAATAPETEIRKEASATIPIKKETVEVINEAASSDRPAESSPIQVARDKTRETFQRASSVALGAIEDTGKRVEKIHHVSSVVLEEATYDPSLRFVLVALGLFIVFIILLVLSKVMG
jgi:hypothetical protein